eukprot:589440-Prymnesium_polylepis.1
MDGDASSSSCGGEFARSGSFAESSLANCEARHDVDTFAADQPGVGSLDDGAYLSAVQDVGGHG